MLLGDHVQASTDRQVCRGDRLVGRMAVGTDVMKPRGKATCHQCTGDVVTIPGNPLDPVVPAWRFSLQTRRENGARSGSGGQ